MLPRPGVGVNRERDGMLVGSGSGRGSSFPPKQDSPGSARRQREKPEQRPAGLGANRECAGHPEAEGRGQLSRVLQPSQ
jgi:hypothetical protein